MLSVVRPFLCALVATALAWILFDAPAWAATIPVTTTVDESGTNLSACSLREAITAANTDSDFGGCSTVSGADIITLPAGTYTLTLVGTDDANAAGDLDIQSDLTISGTGAPSTIVDGNRPLIGERVFDVRAPANAVTFDGLTIRNGLTGIGNSGVPLTVSNSLLTGNSGGLGGGIFHIAGVLTVINSTLSGNSALFGGGLYNLNGTVTLTNSTVSGNTATPNAGTGGNGGGIYNDHGSVTITTSTISQNRAVLVTPDGGTGGGIYTDHGTLIITNSTLSGNTADIVAGAISSDNAALTLAGSTLSGNSAFVGGGFDIFGGTTTMRADLLDTGTRGANCHVTGSTFTSNGSNLSDDTSCQALFTLPSDKNNVNLMLGPLASNGGPTQTHALLPGSPAIDALAGNCPVSTDQRGSPRPRDGDGNGSAVCDSGAFELAPGVLQFSSPTYGVDEAAGSAAITLNRTDGSDVAVSATVTLSDGTAVAPADYSNAPLAVSFAAGQTIATVQVPIVGDVLDETDETVKLTLSNPTGGASIGAQSTAGLTIQDNDPTPALSIDDVSVNEGNSGASAMPVSVHYATADGIAALADNDYQAASGTLTFQPGVLKQSFIVNVGVDGKVEPNETFVVNLTTPTNATIAQAQGTGTILNDDLAPVSVCAPRPPVRVAPVATGDGRLQVTVSVTNNPGFTNALQAITWGEFRDATVQVNSLGPVTSGQRTSLPPGTTVVMFIISRVTPGQAATASLTVTDACGDWPTLVGGGASAF
jgi:CSLREA domain-containing protein